MRARDKGRSDREYVLYSSSGTPATALKAVVAAASDPDTLWKEQVRRQEASSGSGVHALPEIL